MNTANIGPRERRRRLLTGLGALAVGILLAAVLIIMRAPAGARLVVMLPFWVAGIGLFQHMDKT